MVWTATGGGAVEVPETAAGAGGAMGAGVFGIDSAAGGVAGGAVMESVCSEVVAAGAPADSCMPRYPQYANAPQPTRMMTPMIHSQGIPRRCSPATTRRPASGRVTCDAKTMPNPFFVPGSYPRLGKKPL